MFEVGHRHRTLADADGLRQGRTGRLVAHVRAVRHVVGAERPNHQLVQERGLVGGPPRGVEDRLIRVRQRPQMLGDHRVGIVPVDRLVVEAARPDDHRVRQPALATEPVVGACEQFRYRMAGEETGVDGASGGFLGDSLGAVLAEFGTFPVTWCFRPRAARAVEAMLLVQLRQGAGGAHRTHLLESVPQRDQHRRYPGGIGFALADFDVVLVVNERIADIGHTLCRTHRSVGEHTPPRESRFRRREDETPCRGS